MYHHHADHDDGDDVDDVDHDDGGDLEPTENRNFESLLIQAGRFVYNFINVSVYYPPHHQPHHHHHHHHHHHDNGEVAVGVLVPRLAKADKPEFSLKV